MRLAPVLRRLASMILAVAGMAGIAYLVVDVGVERLARAMTGALWALPVVATLELGVLFLDARAARVVLGEAGAEVPRRVWISSSGAAAVCAAFLPGGRFLGEVARATQLGAHVSAGLAARAAITTHGLFLLSIPVSALLAYLVVGTEALGPTLGALLLWTAGFNTVLGAALVFGARAPFISRISRISRIVARVIPTRLRALVPPLDSVDSTIDLPRPVPPALGLFVVARALQWGQGAVAIAAVGRFGTLGGLAAVGASEALALVGAHLGDAVPARAGVVEALFTSYGTDLAIATTPEGALAVCLVVHLGRALGATALGTLGAALARTRRIRRGRASRTLAAHGVVLLTVSISSSGVAQDSPRWVAQQRIAAVFQPMGAEHMMGVGLRWPFADERSPLTADRHLEIGAVNYASPVYSMTGGYVVARPWAILDVRAELTQKSLWAIGIPGAGFYALDGYDAQVGPAALPGGRGEAATGFNAQLGVIFRFAVQLGRLRPILWSSAQLEHEQLGEQPFHYSPKYDLVLARSDTMIASSSMALLEVTLTDRTQVALGAYDDFRLVLGSGARSHTAGAMALFSWSRPERALRTVQIFARAGAFAQPTRRQGQLTGVAGIILAYELGPL